MDSTNQLIIFIVAILLITGLLIPKDIFIDPVRDQLQSFSDPFMEFSYNQAKKIKNFTLEIGSLRKIIIDNQKLEEDNAKLIAENSELLEYKFENQLLKEQLEFQNSSGIKTIPARIIFKDPNSFSQIYKINIGKKQGVREGAPVIKGKYLIGRIERVFQDSSTVFLITNRDSVVNALVTKSRAFGVVKGELGYGLVMESIPQDADVAVGDLIVSSGLSGKIPKDLLIGKVNEVISDESDIFKQVSLTPLVDFSKLELVFIIK